MMRKITDCIRVDNGIQSRSNPLVVSLAKLTQNKFRQENRLFLAEGVKLTCEALTYADVYCVLFCSDDGYMSSHILDAVAPLCTCVQTYVLSSGAFQKISTENAPQGVIAVVRFPTEMHRMCTAAETAYVASPDERIIALDSVRDPGNLGTMIRTAAAFGYDRMLLGDCADIYNPKTVRAAMGTLFRMRIDLCASLPETLRFYQKQNRRVLAAALSAHSMELGTDRLLSSDCVVIGNEGHGVSAEILDLADAVLRIPMKAGTESLNAAGAASVVMWEYYRNFK